MDWLFMLWFIYYKSRLLDIWCLQINYDSSAYYGYHRLVQSESLAHALRLDVLWVIFQEVVSHEFDGVFGSNASHLGEGLEDDGDYCLVQIGSNGEDAGVVLLRLSYRVFTSSWELICVTNKLI